MVFTVRVRRADHGLSRRGVLSAAVGGLAALGLGACDVGSRRTVRWHLAPDVLLPFLASTVALADTYDAAIRTLPALATQLTPLRDAHRQHVTALRRELGLAETSATPTPPVTTTARPTTAPPTTAPPTTAPPTSPSPGALGPSGSADPSASAEPRSSASSSPGNGTGGSASAPPSQSPSPVDNGRGGDPAPAGTPSKGALPGDRAGLIAALRTAEQKGQQDAVAACLAAPSYRAALLGSIAACRATHLTVLT